MKTRIGILLVLCTVLSCTSTAGGQNRKTDAFRKVQVSSGIDVYFTQEKSRSVRIETQNVNENEVITEVKGETLVIKMKSRNSWGNKMKRSVKVYISAPVLEGISMSGGADFYADNLKSTSFSIATSGGADVKIGNLAVDNMTNIATSGGSDCNIKNLKTGNCTIATSGGSDVVMGVEISGKLTIATSGSSDIKLSGKANTVWITASGSSDVDVRNLKYKQIDSKASSGADIRK